MEELTDVVIMYSLFCDDRQERGLILSVAMQ